MNINRASLAVLCGIAAAVIGLLVLTGGIDNLKTAVGAGLIITGVGLAL